MASPRMGVNTGAVKQLSSGKQFSRRQQRQHVRGIVVQVGCVDEGLRPNITLIVFWKTQVRVDHQCARITNISLDTVFCNCILMVPVDPNVLDILTL